MEIEHHDEIEKGEHNEDEGTNNNIAGDLVWLSVAEAFN